MTARIALRLLAASAPLLAASCAPAPKPAPVNTVPTPRPTQIYTPPPVVEEPDYANFLDAPQTPGDWTFDREASGSLAQFVSPANMVEFSLRCDLPTRRVELSRPGRAPAAVPMRVRTETAERLVSATPDTGGAQRLGVELTSYDPLLDAIAFSRGRFAVETAGLQTLYLPAWPEITRVVEDCR
ncbi:hypothetical protein [Parerythrobacter lacustris]|uniref:Lipoprotein n=1 Tax=Parerythrobacter lacustris TaxID=2969984 RepID=A0ABT1XP02_9SPHN|nr:hypothetical protein [Parerythrobacter lacustris]MCR2833389.1 hypothetical protein [Parerythrobacter lacustris]